jgi:hypothetical protein
VTYDDLATLAVEVLRVLGTSADDQKREDYVRSVLLTTYQAGVIAANEEQIEQNNRALRKSQAV